MNETLYELLKDFEDPSGKISAGVRKTEHQWIGRFALLNFGDCKKKTDWFKEIKSPLFTTKDGVGILSEYTDKLLMEELGRRGFKGKLSKEVVVSQEFEI